MSVLCWFKWKQFVSNKSIVVFLLLFSVLCHLTVPVQNWSYLLTISKKKRWKNSFCFLKKKRFLKKYHITEIVRYLGRGIILMYHRILKTNINLIRHGDGGRGGESARADSNYCNFQSIQAIITKLYTFSQTLYGNILFCQFCAHVTWRFHGNHVSTSCLGFLASRNFRWYCDLLFYWIVSSRILTGFPSFFFFFFFLTFLKNQSWNPNSPIQDGGFFKCLTSLWHGMKSLRHVTSIMLYTPYKFHYHNENTFGDTEMEGHSLPRQNEDKGNV